MSTKENIKYKNFKDGNEDVYDNCVYLLTRVKSATGRWGATQCSDQSPRYMSSHLN